MALKSNPEYTEHHPKWYRVRMPIFWWVHKWAHTRFILRELTSVAVAYCALVLLFLARALSQGAEAYVNFLAWQQKPVIVVLNIIAFVFVIFHSVTWFNLAPKALVIKLGKKPLPGVMIAALNYGAWIVISAILAWIILTA